MSRGPVAMGQDRPDGRWGHRPSRVIQWGSV